VLNDDEPCTDADACRYDLFCLGIAQGEGVCTRRLEDGDACDPADHEPCSQLCDEGGDCRALTCIEGACQLWQPWACGVAPLSVF
jgi:hypothetical protein